MRLFQRRRKRPEVTFVDDFDGSPLPLWAVRAGMLVVGTDYHMGDGSGLRVRVRRENATARWDEQKPMMPLWSDGMDERMRAYVAALEKTSPRATPEPPQTAG